MRPIKSVQRVRRHSPARPLRPSPACGPLAPEASPLLALYLAVCRIIFGPFASSSVCVVVAAARRTPSESQTAPRRLSSCMQAHCPRGLRRHRRRRHYGQVERREPAQRRSRLRRRRRRRLPSAILDSSARCSLTDYVSLRLQFSLKLRLSDSSSDFAASRNRKPLESRAQAHWVAHRSDASLQSGADCGAQ